MKKIYLLLLFIGFISCSSDDDTLSNDNQNPNPNPEPIEEITNYFPLVEGNEWNYANVTTSEAESSNTSETLSVENENETEGIIKYELASTSEGDNFSMTRILSSGSLYKNNGKLLLTGNLNFDLGEEGDFPGVDVDFEDLVIYDENAVSGSLIYNVEENFTLPEFNNITLAIIVQIQSKSLGTQPQLEIDGITYEDILSSSIVFKLAVTATVVLPQFPLPLTINIVDNQEVLSSVNHFANQIGLVKSDTRIALEFNDLGGLFPLELEDILVEVEQKLQSYQVELEE